MLLLLLAMPLGQSCAKGTGAFLGSKYSKKEIIDYGGISERSQLCIRRSNRIRAQPNADSPQLERVQQQAAAHDPASFSGTKYLNKYSLSSFSHEEVVRRAKTLGASLGSSSSQIDQSVHIFKETDVARTLFTLKRNEEQTLANKDDHGSLVLDEANKLSVDLLEEEGKDLEDHKDPSIPPKKSTRSFRKKPKEVKLPTRRSKRLKEKN
jgi:hypothetical protein